MTLSGIQRYELEQQRTFAIERAESILSDSPPILREKVTYIKSIIEGDWRRSVVSRYQIAVTIRDIYDDVTDNKGAVYGARAVEVIQKLFGWNIGSIYQAINVANAYTEEQIEQFTQMQMPDGRALSFSHMITLASVEDEQQREKLLKQAVKEGWTTRKLANAADVGTTPVPDMAQERRGRPIGKPRDFDAVIDQQARSMDDFLNRNEQVWSHDDYSLTAKARDMVTSDITHERVERLKKHVDQMKLLAEKAKERAEEAACVHERFADILKLRAAQNQNGGSEAIDGTKSAA